MSLKTSRHWYISTNFHTIYQRATRGAILQTRVDGGGWGQRRAAPRCLACAFSCPAGAYCAGSALSLTTVVKTLGSFTTVLAVSQHSPNRQLMPALELPPPLTRMDGLMFEAKKTTFPAKR